MNPLVSIIIPTHNRSKYLSEAIDSVLTQTCRDFEVIVVDDGSTDDTKKTVEAYIVEHSGKFRYFYQENKGVCAARNKGIQEANGHYVAFLDSDDIWMPNKLEVYLKHFAQNSEVCFIESRMFVIDKNGRMIPNRLKPQGNPGHDLKSFVEKGTCPTSTFMVKKEILKNIKFDESLRKLTDTDFSLSIAKDYKVLNIDEIVSIYRDHDDNSFADKVVSYDSQVRFWQKVISKYGDKADLKFCQKKIARNTYLLAKAYCDKKNYRQCFQNICISLKNNFVIGTDFLEKEDSFLTKVVKFFKPYGFLIISMVRSLFEKSSKNEKLQPEPQNILFYDNSSGYGGAARCLIDLLEKLDQTKFYPIVFYKHTGVSFQKLPQMHVEHVKLKDHREARKMPKLMYIFYIFCAFFPEVIKIYFFIKRRKIVLTHVNTNIMGGLPAIVASHFAGIPCVSHIRQTRKLIRRERQVVKWIHQIILLNKDAYRIYQETIPKERLSIIYDGIDLEKYDQISGGNFRKENNFVNGEILVGLVGRIVEGKGHREFVLAAKEICQKRENLKFIIVGDDKGDTDDYISGIKTLIHDEGMGKNIIFTGWRDDVESIIKDFDVLVQASSTFPEGLGLTILEAMTLHVPVVATDIPGPSEIVENEKNGILVAPGDPHALADAVIRVLTHPELAAKLKKAGRKRIEEFFELNKMVKIFEELYERAIK